MTSVVYGILGTALAQAIVAIIGFLIAGVPGPFFLGLLTFFLSPIPAGPVLVWVGATLWLLHTGDTFWAVFIALWGLLVISSIDNFLKPYLISRGCNLPLVLILLGIMGGAIAFGALGVFLGPTLLAIAYAVLKEWNQVDANLNEP